ncbi:MAG: MerR family DNA-binding transcriptional regulator [Phyllobacteriaceae bacterium]|nr:MerR family DNA-binding transcriptional regulator [Phyllobacteriaceae bacterium]
MNNVSTSLSYSVGQFARLAGVTVRALHFYDERGLLKPQRQRQNRRRQYQPRICCACNRLSRCAHWAFV